MNQKPAFLFDKKYFALRVIIIIAFTLLQWRVLIPMAQRKFVAWEKQTQAQTTATIAQAK